MWGGWGGGEGGGWPGLEAADLLTKGLLKRKSRQFFLLGFFIQKKIKTIFFIWVFHTKRSSGSFQFLLARKSGVGVVITPFGSNQSLKITQLVRWGLLVTFVWDLKTFLFFPRKFKFVFFFLKERLRGGESKEKFV